MQGKNIFIVGASSGIGHALAESLQAQGAALFTAGRTQPDAIQSTHMSWDAVARDYILPGLAIATAARPMKRTA